MIDIIFSIRDAYRFGSASELTRQNADRLIEQFTTGSDADAVSVLGGRRSVSITALEGFGSVVVKHFRRGGLLARLNKQTYVKTGKPRCQLEFEQLAFARSIGVSAPEPVAFAFRGTWVYQGWLVTKMIENQQSLADLSINNPDRAEAALTTLAGQVARLIENKMLHADFHPGNVLVNDRNDVFIIDFDKARIFRGSRRQLTERYQARWLRAIDKHHLPKMLGERMQVHFSALF